MPRRIYCQNENRVPSVEHVVAEGLEGPLKLPAEAVCKSCNNKVLGDGIDVLVRNDSSAERRKLVARAGNTYEFRAASPEELEKARAELEAKHPGKRVVLGDIEKRPLVLPQDRLDEVDFSAAHWSRWAAKTCLNPIAYAWGVSAAHATDFRCAACSRARTRDYCA